MGGYTTLAAAAAAADNPWPSSDAAWDEAEEPDEPPKPARRSPDDRERAALMRKTAEVLQRMCEAAGLPKGGTKSTMVDHLLERRARGTRPARLTPAMLGVGGLEAAVAELDTRVWLPHVAPAAAAARLDVTPPLGVLLYGPPGCGKSHLAVALANAISSVAPKIVKGPELKSALWGQDEQGVRSLFEEGYRKEDEAEAVRVVILDEAESLLSARSELGAASAKHYARRRGVSNSRPRAPQRLACCAVLTASGPRVVQNSTVTQFLACMDGAAERQAERAKAGGRRLLLLALTNRREMLDAALLRPGRFEVQVELPLPDEAGRHAILTLLTDRLQQQGALEPAAHEDFALLARASVGLSGADLAGVVREAKSAALRRFCEAHEDAQVVSEGGGATLLLARPALEHALEEATLTRAELRAALRAELKRREERGEPCTPVKILDSEARAADQAAELAAELKLK